MKYSKAFDIWQVSENALAQVQPGQWVYAGTPENKGIFLGVKPSGSIVCAWHNIGKNCKLGFYGYIRTLRNYALGK